eukprot:m.126777 g.126777  ORF g.126777 m.126777 type:complete len:59 (+) comp13843_c0_seq4:946-1122(+)
MICVAYTAPMVDSGRRLELRMYLSSSDDLPEKAAPHTHNLKAVACACIAPSLVNNVVP